MAVIEARDVSKSYGKFKALNGLSVSVDEGSVFALLGPNGAGKTTFIKCALGLVRPDSGILRLSGLTSDESSSREQIAYLPERFNFFGFETPVTSVTLFARLRGVPSQELEGQVRQALERAGIPDLAQRKLRTFSKGQLQRVGMASLLVGRPRVYFLDEPFSGLDPLGIKDLKGIIHELKKNGATIFVNSHILSEMEQMCDHFAILNRGECLAQGPLRATLGGK